MASHEKDIFVRGLFAQVARERKFTVRPVYEQPRRSEALLAVAQLPVEKSSQLRVQQWQDASVTPEEEAAGIFWHVWGYSKIGGPDKMRP